MAGVVFLCACGDAPMDPMVGVVAEETHAALALGVSFVEPGAMAPEGTLSAQGTAALDAWRSSWDEPQDVGRSLREQSYDGLADALAPVVSDGELRGRIALLGDGVQRARELTRPGLPAYLGGGIRRAGDAWSAAVDASAHGDTHTALVQVFRGSDALREVGPEAVARSLQEGVELEYRRVLPDESYSEANRERLDRLVRGGRQALEEGAWVLAIRRAYYAKALLEGR